MLAAHSLRRAESESAFFRSPRGLFVTEANAAYWCWSPELWGATVVGHADTATVRALARWITEERRLDGPLHSAVFDLRGLRGIDPAAFLVFASFIREPARRFTVGRGAVIPPAGGLAEAAVVGATAILETRRQWFFADSLDHALRSLEQPGAEPAVESVLTTLLEEQAVVEKVEALLASDSPRTTSSEIARLLGLSTRTLQRRLRDANETLRSIRERVRLRSTQRLLVDTDHKIAFIAAELGFSSAGQLTRVFRRLTGLSPTEWRARSRTSAAREVRGK